jgi:uncharacterized protein (TIGR04255 family)
MLKASFQQTPLTEVICGITFSAPEFASVHFGLYWQSIKADYPNLPIDTQPIGEVPLLSIPPKLRRVWFESLDKHKVIQLHSDKFLYNWRKLDEQDRYPHFQDVAQGFAAEWQHFQAWWHQLVQETKSVSPLPITTIEPVYYELTYLNHIDAAMGWHSPDDNPKIFRFLAAEWQAFALGSPKVHNVSLEFLLPNQMGILSLIVTQGLKLQDNSPILVCELTARSFDAKIPFNQWFGDTHEAVVKSFIDLLQEDIKKAWGFKWLEQ